MLLQELFYVMFFSLSVSYVNYTMLNIFSVPIKPWSVEKP